MVEIRKAIGEHKLAVETIQLPPEREAIAALQGKVYAGFEAVEEAERLGLMRNVVRHAELSPTFTCPEDCGGCPDRASLHVNDKPEVTITDEEWLQTADKLRDKGVEYFMLIGGTIDRRSVTPKLMNHILEMEASADFGWFTDGIMLQSPRTGRPTKLFERLVTEGRMLEATTHVSADYLVLEGQAFEGAILDPNLRWENEYGGSRYYKSAYGERLARQLVEANAKRVVLNTAISSHNLDEVLPVYNYVRNLQAWGRRIGSDTVVLHTVSPWVYRPHLARGDDPRNYDATSLLSEIDQGKLAQITEYILEDTKQRMLAGVPRAAGNSSGFLAGLSEFAITQDVPYTHSSGELAVQPDGLVRVDPVFVSAEMLKFARNPYGYRDRDIDKNPFEVYNDSNVRFPNLIQTTRGDVLWR